MNLNRLNKRRHLVTCLLSGVLGASITCNFLLTAENDKLKAFKIISEYTIKTLTGRIENLQSLISSKNTKISDLINELERVKTTTDQLLKEVALQKSMMDAYSNTLEKANDKIESLERQIKVLDESIQEFADEIVKVSKELSTLRDDYNTAVRAVFEIDNINKQLNSLLKEAVLTQESLLSYLSFYDKNSVVMKQGTCIHQLVKDTENDTEAYPYRECDGEILVDGQKIDNFTVTIRPKDTEDKNSDVYKGLKKLYENSLKSNS